MRRHFQPTSRLACGCAIALAALCATGCGGGSSQADQAKSQACSASADIGAQVDTLKGLPPVPSSVDAARTAVRKIGADLTQISAAAPNATADLKQRLKAADSAFRADLERITQSVTSAASPAAALSALRSAGTDLAASYRDAFGDLGC
jgi:hypothetical protein